VTIELTGGVLMKSLSISVIVVTLVAAPVSAGMMTSEEGDQRAQCGLRATRMIVNEPEESEIFPEDVTNCREINGETGGESNIDSFRVEPTTGSAGSERSVDLATLAPVASR
jgi:hypothetical protein